MLAELCSNFWLVMNLERAIYSLVSPLYGAKQPGNFDNFVKQRKLNCLEAHQDFETKAHRASSLARELDSQVPLLGDAKRQVISIIL